MSADEWYNASVKVAAASSSNEHGCNIGDDSFGLMNSTVSDTLSAAVSGHYVVKKR